MQPNIETDDDITPLLSSVAAGSLASLELLIQVSVFLYPQIYQMDFVPELSAYLFYKLEIYKCRQYYSVPFWRL